jgi:predicted outer membrane protein
MGGGQAVPRFRNSAAFTIILTLAACGGGEQPSSAPRTSARRLAPRPAQPRQPAVSEASFIAENGSFDLFVIRASELAMQRSSSPRIRDFAHTMIADHKGTSGQLSLQGRRLNLLPSATLQSNEQAMFDSLQSSSSFDAEYVRDMRKLHQQAVALDSAYATNGQSPTLRPVAAAALRTEQRHLRLLAYL